MPTLCFDGDTAGQKAAHRALDTALPYLEPGRTLQFVFLPEGRDPDDMVRGGAAEALAKLVTQPLALIDVLWSREQARHPLETPEQRASLEARLMELVRADRAQEPEVSLHRGAPGAAARFGNDEAAGCGGPASRRRWRRRPFRQARLRHGKRQNRQPAFEQDRSSFGADHRAARSAAHRRDDPPPLAPRRVFGRDCPATTERSRIPGACAIIY